MERTTSIRIAQQIMGTNFIGPEELSSVKETIPLSIPSTIPEIHYSVEELIEKSNDYILILGLSKMNNGDPVTIKLLRSIFGTNPSIMEPCFYNQDWYMNESFVNIPLDNKWYLIQKNIYDDSRSKLPEHYDRQISLPLAIQCVFAFFTNFFIYNGEKLWEFSYVWCSDFDTNGDRVYVGRYTDELGLNNNGFSIHRHLRIKNNYGIIGII